MSKLLNRLKTLKSLKSLRTAQVPMMDRQGSISCLTVVMTLIA